MENRKLRAREQRARRHVEKCGDGFKLTKKRGGGYMIVHPESASVVLNGDDGGWSLTLDEVEAFAQIKPN